MDEAKIAEAFSLLKTGFENIRSISGEKFSDEIFLAGEKSSKLFASEEAEHPSFLGLIRGNALMGIGSLIQTRYVSGIEKLNLALSSIKNLEDLVVPHLVQKEKYQNDIMEVKVIILVKLIEALKEISTLDDVPRLYEELFLITVKEGRHLFIGHLALKMAFFHFKSKSYSLAVDKCKAALSLFQDGTFRSLLGQRLFYLINLVWKPAESVVDAFSISRLMESSSLHKDWVDIELQFVELVMTVEGAVEEIRLMFQAEKILQELLKKTNPSTFSFITILIQVKHARWILWRKDIYQAKEDNRMVREVYSTIEHQLQQNYDGFIMYVFKDIVEELTHLALDVQKKYVDGTLMEIIIRILDKVFELAPVGLKGRILYMKGKVYFADRNFEESATCFDMAKDFFIETHGANHPLVTLVSAEKNRETRVNWMGDID